MFTELSVLFMSTLPVTESEYSVVTAGIDLTEFFEHHVVIYVIQVSGSAF